MNKENTTKYLLIVGELEENDLFYHKKNFLDLLQYANVVICLTEETNQKVKDFFKKEINSELITIKLSDFLDIKDKYDYKIYTGYLSAKDEIITNYESKVYYLLNNKIKIKDTLDIVCKNNFDKIISHLLPSELPKSLSENTYKFICSALYHIPCSLVERIKLNSAQVKKIIFIYDKNSKYFKDFEKVYRGISENKNIDLLDIDDLKLSNFCSNNGLINSNSKIVLLDVNAHERVFLVNFCLVNDLSISVIDRDHLYDREIIDLIDSGIVKSEINTDQSIRSRFIEFLDSKSTCYKLLEHNDFVDKNFEFVNFIFVNNRTENDFRSIISKKYIELINSNRGDVEYNIINPVFKPNQTVDNKCLNFCISLLDEHKKLNLSKLVISKIYFLLLNSLLHETNEWKVFNILIRYVPIRPEIYLESLKLSCSQNIKSRNFKFILNYSTIIITLIKVDESIFKSYLNFYKSLDSYSWLVLYLRASSTNISKSDIDSFEKSAIEKTIFNMVVYNLQLNEFQESFILENSPKETCESKVSIYTLYNYMINKLLLNKSIDFNDLKQSNPTTLKLFVNNPNHLFRFGTLAWSHGNIKFLQDIINFAPDDLLSQNNLHSLFMDSLLILLNKGHKPKCYSSDLLNTDYNQVCKIFHLQVISYKYELNLNLDEILKKYTYKFNDRIKILLENHFRNYN